MVLLLLLLLITGTVTSTAAAATTATPSSMHEQRCGRSTAHLVVTHAAVTAIIAAFFVVQICHMVPEKTKTKKSEWRER